MRGVEHFQFADGTLEDILPPTLDSFAPADAAMSVPVNSNIVLTFNEAIQAGTGLIEIHQDSFDGTIVESYDAATSANLTISDATLTINPTTDLENGAHYFVTFDAGSVKDSAGNSYAGTTAYDFTTEAAAPLRHSLTGSVTFWKSGAAITDVTNTITSQPVDTATHTIEFRNVQLLSDGSRTIEVWENSPRADIHSLQLDIMFEQSSTAIWQSAAELPAGWSSITNTDTAGHLVLAGIGLTSLAAVPLQLGILRLSAPDNPERFELALGAGWMADEAITPFSIMSDRTTTDETGHCTFTDIRENSYAVTADKTADNISNAVTAADALAALKMAVALNPNADGSAVSPYQFLAADINHDGKIRSTDALNILKMAVGLSSAPEKEWIFVPETIGSQTMTRNTVDWSNADIAVTLDHNVELDLIGIVKGDVNGSWIAVG